LEESTRWREGKTAKNNQRSSLGRSKGPQGKLEAQVRCIASSLSHQQGKNQGDEEKEAQTDLAYVAKPLVPHILSEKDRKEKLKENLKKMGCSYLMDIPWKWTTGVMLKELATRKVPDQFQDTMRGHPKKWTQEFVARALNLGVEGGRDSPESINRGVREVLQCSPPYLGWVEV
jgi:hypothetical protein